MAKMLLKRVINPTIDGGPLKSTIRRIATSIAGTYQQKKDTSEDRLMRALYTAAANHLGSHAIGQLIASEPERQTQATDDLNHLLFAAAMLGSLTTLEVMLSRGARVNSASEYFGSPLQAAAVHGHHDMVLYLLERGANVNYVCNVRRGTALRSASRRNSTSVVRLLLDPLYGLKTSGLDYHNAVKDAAHGGEVSIEKNDLRIQAECTIRSSIDGL